METEFVTRVGFDLELSVYHLDTRRLSCQPLALRVRAEHNAACELAPKSAVEVDLADLGAAPARSIGCGRFTFMRDQHRELRFGSEQELRRFAQRVVDEIAERRLNNEKREIVAYAQSKLIEGDAEWANARCRGWLRKWSGLQDLPD